MSRQLIYSVHVTIRGVIGEGEGRPHRANVRLCLFYDIHTGHTPRFLIEMSCRPLLLHFSHTQENWPIRLLGNCLPAASAPQLCLSPTHTVSVCPHVFSFFRKHS